MATSEVSISNMAIGWLGGNLITSLDDASNEAALCKANYAICRDAVLEDRDWTFAMSRKALSPLTSTPIGYAYQYQIPSDLIRVVNFSDEPLFVHDLHWERQGDVLVTDAAIVYLKYIMRVTDPTKFSSGFVHALAARIAMEIALPLTNSAEMQQSMSQLFGVKLERAGAMDGMQGKNVPLRTSRLIGVR